MGMEIRSAIRWYSSTIRTSPGVGSRAGATMTASAPRSCAIRRCPGPGVTRPDDDREAVVDDRHRGLHQGLALIVVQPVRLAEDAHDRDAVYPHRHHEVEQASPRLQIEAFFIVEGCGEDRDDAAEHVASDRRLRAAGSVPSVAAVHRPVRDAYRSRPSCTDAPAETWKPIGKTKNITACP